MNPTTAGECQELQEGLPKSWGQLCELVFASCQASWRKLIFDGFYPSQISAPRPPCHFSQLANFAITASDITTV